MLVVVDAGQGLIGVAIEVRVLPAHIAIASPAHVALEKGGIRGWETGKSPGRSNRCSCQFLQHPLRLGQPVLAFPLTAQEISPFLSNMQKPLMSQGLEVGVLQDRCGMQPDV